MRFARLVSAVVLAAAVVAGGAVAVDAALGSGVSAAASNEPPLAEAGLDRQVLQGATVVLDGAGSRDPDGEIVDYRWSIEGPDGSTFAPACSTCAHTNFTPTQPGRYAVTLTVEDDDGATASDTLYVRVEAADPPSVSVAGPRSANVDETRTYTADVTPGDLRLARLVWSVDGRVVANRSATAPGADRLQVTFEDPGRHTVSVEAVDAVGNAGGDALEVRATESDGGSDAPAAPIARVDANRTTVPAGGAVRFTGVRSSDPDAGGEGTGIREYRWDTDSDGQFDDARGAAVTARFDAATTVGLVVVDDDGQRSEPATVSVAVGETTETPGTTPPTARFETNATAVCTNGEVRVDPRESRDTDAVGAAPEDAVETTAWYVDGSLRAVNDGRPVETLRLTESGTATVRLVVVDDDGQRDATTRTVAVRGAGEGDCAADRPPVAVVEDDAGDGAVGAGTVVNFDGSSSYDPDAEGDGAGIERYVWTVDGERVAEGGVETTAYTFESGGEHEVRLRVVDDEGSTDTATTTVTVSPDGQAGGNTYRQVEVVAPRQDTEYRLGGGDSQTVYYKVCLGPVQYDDGSGQLERYPGGPESATEPREAGLECGGDMGALLRDGDHTLTVTYEYREGQLRTVSYASSLPGPLEFRLPEDGVATDRQIKAVVEGPRVQNGRIADVDYVDMCTVDVDSTSKASNLRKLYPGFCDVENVPVQETIGIEVTGDAGPVAENATTTHVAELEHTGLYDDWTVSWTIDGLVGRETGSGERVRWSTEHHRPYSVGVDVTGEVTGTATSERVQGTITRSSEDTMDVTVCPEGEAPDASGSCSNDNPDEDGSGGDPGSGKGGSDGSECVGGNLCLGGEGASNLKDSGTGRTNEDDSGDKTGAGTPDEVSY